MGTLQVGGTTLGVKNTSTNKVDLSNVGDVTLTSSANIKGAINASGNAPIYACRAWVNFDGGSGSGVGYSDITIRGSGNVSSITDSGIGLYDVNFTQEMPNANYSAVATAGESIYHNTATKYLTTPTVNTFRVATYGLDSSDAFDDDSKVSVVVFG